MTKNGWFKNYTKMLEVDDEEEIINALTSIQNLLSDNQAYSKRISFLELLGSSSDKSKGVENPISDEQMAILVRKGLVTAYKDGSVTASEVFKLAHSVPGLEAFTHAFGQTPRKERASCWSEIAFTPSYAPEVNLEKLLLSSQPASIWDYISKLANDWAASITQLQPCLALSAAGDSKVRPAFNQESSQRISSLLLQNKIEKRLAIEYQCKLMDGISSGTR